MSQFLLTFKEHYDVNVGWVSEILFKWFEGGPSYGNYQHAV